MKINAALTSEAQMRRRTYLVASILAALIIIVFFISMNTGQIKLSPQEVISSLFGAGTKQQELILWEFRLPRIVISVLIGAGLAISGCILQGITRNALADPGILGINSGAGLVIALFIAYVPLTTAVPVFLLPLMAFLGAAATAALIYALAYKKRDGISTSSLLLTGIAVTAGINAAMIVLTLRLNPADFQRIATWLAGSIWGTTWKFVFALLPWIVLLIPYVLYKARTLDVLNLGETTATGLGAPVKREQLLLIAASVALAGASVAVSGGIGFVGLIGPHLARRLVGPRHRYLMPVTALTGALLVLIADTVGRVILHAGEVPTGIVVAVIGAPYFLYLMARSKA
ncbi:iron ABC transporter permease [Paenibacillus nanensis]|uniref:Iron ABC transporter permease n=1 Tax=Paenibacillus nanensis TaxID=393251 RepID=A0A3A1VIY5_9BACL|nr:iron ABC transporter permease [Paenibacillus nanensis]RIX60274.1 iron ABC transporter permease [Paenibacillus nanensis]